MTVAFPRHDYTMAEYRALERETDRKHEYFDGEIYAMTGGSPMHAQLGATVAYQLSRQLEGKPCRVYSSDLGVRALATGLATYTDVTVVRGPLELDPEDADTVTNPTVLVEVTSPTSEKRDRGDKLEHYKTIPSLRAVVVVSHRERRVEVHGRTDAHGRTGAAWVMQAATGGAIFVPGIDCSLDVDELYAATEPTG